jgi:hypothetical protein
MHPRHASAFVLVMLSSSIVGCDDDGPVGLPEARLRPLVDCGEALDYVRDIAHAKMNAEVDRRIAQYESGEYCGGWRGGYGGGYEDASDAPTGQGGGPPAPPPSPEGNPSQGTGTNNQVAGVDEADFVKNDGQYLYLAQNGVFRIVDVWPAAETHEVSATAIEGTPRKLFVVGDRAVVYVAVPAVDGGPPPGADRECTYGYDCDFSGDGSATKILVFDLADRAAPRLIRQITSSGSLIAARRIDNAVHTVVAQSYNPYPALDYDPGDADLCGYRLGGYYEEAAPPPMIWRMRARLAFDAMRARNHARIDGTDLGGVVPVIGDSAGAAEGGLAGAGTNEQVCAGLYASPLDDGAAFTTVMSLDLAQTVPMSTATVVSRAGAVYASANALYMAVPSQYGAYGENDMSSVHKFRISRTPGDTAYVGSGAVVGRALNQFAMDEKDGFLRIATTDGHAPSPDATSRMSVLGEDGDELVIVGEVTEIAPSEDIRSVRFDGDRAFIVTFKKTDPLFSFDLSDPTSPKLLGELKIPGFSTYMHLLDDGHLLSIGYDADDHGDFAYFDGVLLQIFDVSDPAMPLLAHRHVIGTRGSSSEALTNHLAFTWYPEEALLAVPMTICEGGDDGQYGEVMSFSGLMLFDVSTAVGIGEHGRVAHPVPDSITCNNWWTNASSAVRRSLFLDNFVYSISDAHLKVQDIDALGTDLASLPL